MGSLFLKNIDRNTTEYTLYQKISKTLSKFKNFDKVDFISKLKKIFIHKIRKRYFQIRFYFHRSFDGENSAFISCPASS